MYRLGSELASSSLDPESRSHMDPMEARGREELEKNQGEKRVKDHESKEPRTYHGDTDIERVSKGQAQPD